MPQIRVIGANTDQLPYKLRVAAYCRVSSDSDDQLNSYLAQVDYYTKLIESTPEWELVDIYADEGITGTRADKREDFQRLLRDCRKGRIDKIIVKAISRFARNTRDCIAITRELKSLGINIYFEKEELDTANMGGEMFLSMHGTLAQEESISISNNMRWSYKKRMQSGEFIGCSSFFGYKLKNGSLHIVEDEAKIVRRIFADYLAGKGTQEIARELIQDGVKKLRGETGWRAGDISRMLKNEKYTGNALLQKSYTTDELPFRKVTNRGERAMYFVGNSHPGIITQEDFDAVQTLITRRGAIAAAAPSSQYPISGKLRCGECGSSFKRRICNGTIYWVCWKHNRSKDECSVKQIVESEVYAAFVRLWNTLLANRHHILSPLLNGLQEIEKRIVWSNAKLQDINREIAELTQRNHMLNQLRLKGYMDSALFMQQIQTIEARLTGLRGMRRQLLDNDEDGAIPQTRTLIEIMEAAVPLSKFDEICFHSIIDTITVESQERIRFRLLGGLEFVEKIQRKRRGGQHEEESLTALWVPNPERQNRLA